MKLVLILAWRNLWRNKRRTLLTAFTVSLGLSLLLIFLGLNDGAHRQMVESAVRMGSGHMVIQAEGYQEFAGLERTLSVSQTQSVIEWAENAGSRFPILHVARRVFSSALASSADGSAGIQIIAIEASEKDYTRFAEKLSSGDFLGDDGKSDALIGLGVARKLELDLGDKMVVMAQGGEGDIQSKLVRVKGIITTGQDEFDQVLVLMPLAVAQDFLNLSDRVHQVAFLLDGPEQSSALATTGATQFPELEVLDWEAALPELTDFIRLDDGGNYLFNIFLFLLIAFMVLNTLLMSVLERNREFSLLDALGLSASRRFFMVLLEASFIGLIALGGGLALGFPLHHYLATTGLSMDAFGLEGASAAGVAFDPIMYSYLSTQRIIQALSLVFAMTVVLGILPARRAAKRGDISILGSHA